MNDTKTFPIVETLSQDIEYTWIPGNSSLAFGIGAGVQGDFSAGYTLPLFNLETDKQGLMFNP